MSKYIEEKLKQWEETFTTPNLMGERQLDQICTTEYTKGEPIIKKESAIVTKHKNFLETALKEQRQEIIKEIEKFVENEPYTYIPDLLKALKQ